MNTCHFFQALNLNKTIHGFFTKGPHDALCNVAFGRGDADDVVLHNRQRVVNSLGHSAQKIIFTNQEHTNKVLVVDDTTVVSEPCDALVTRTPRVLLGVYTADCVPVLLYGETVVGVAHCGWKGLKAELINETISAMHSLGATNIVAAIGPCIRRENYVVDESFLENFPDYANCMSKQADGWHVDLPKIAITQLKCATNIEEICMDTFENPNLFFSCRRFIQADPNALIRTQASVLMLPGDV
ncbi:MAG: polyphenol oxidase family protein [Holosporales bacterium]|nr:polyphenol oxidase family protein [Holosporales bacterium]